MKKKKEVRSAIYFATNPEQNLKTKTNQKEKLKRILIGSLTENLVSALTFWLSICFRDFNSFFHSSSSNLKLDLQ